MDEKRNLKSKGINVLPVIPMRKEPSDRTEMVNQVLYGETFDILEKQPKWSLIRLHTDGYEGWIDNKQFEPFSGKKSNVKDAQMICNLFTKYNGMAIPMGAFVQQANGNAASIPLSAKKFLGAPYLWGGRTFMGIDCSGFTQIVFRVNGIPLPRDAYQQQAKGKKIRLKDSNTGDLAFFNNDEGKVIHVGIILKEKNTTKIIHASGKVRIDILDEKGILHTGSNLYTHRLHSIKRIA